MGLDKSGPRREVVRLLRWSGTEVILYIDHNNYWCEINTILSQNTGLADPWTDTLVHKTQQNDPLQINQREQVNVMYLILRKTAPTFAEFWAALSRFRFRFVYFRLTQHTYIHT